MSLSSNRDWLAFAGEEDTVAAITRRESVLASLDEGQVAELIDLLTSGSDAQRFSAVALLMALAGREDARLTERCLSQFGRLVRSIVLEEYPRTKASIVSFSAWRDLDPDEAKEFLAAEFDPAHLSNEAYAIAVVSQLASLAARDERAKAKLEALTGLPEKAQTERSRALELLRPLSDAEIRSMAGKWRRSRSPEMLAKLYYRYVGAIPSKTVKMKDLIRLLGTPDKGDEKEAHYHPNDGTALYIRGDEEGYLGPRSFS